MGSGVRSCLTPDLEQQSTRENNRLLENQVAAGVHSLKQREDKNRLRMGHIGLQSLENI